MVTILFFIWNHDLTIQVSVSMFYSGRVMQDQELVACRLCSTALTSIAVEYTTVLVIVLQPFCLVQLIASFCLVMLLFVCNFDFPYTMEKTECATFFSVWAGVCPWIFKIALECILRKKELFGFLSLSCQKPLRDGRWLRGKKMTESLKDMIGSFQHAIWIFWSVAAPRTGLTTVFLLILWIICVTVLGFFVLHNLEHG